MPRDTPIPCYAQHKPPRLVAQFMRTVGEDVGKIYRTHGAVWDDDENRKIGLLELIIDQLEHLGQPKVNKLHRHSIFMQKHYDECVDLLKQRDAHLRRIRQLMGGVEVHSPDLNDWADIHFLSEKFCEGSWYAIERLRRVVRKLKTVKTVDDLRKLDRVGKVTLSKIKAATNGKAAS